MESPASVVVRTDVSVSETAKLSEKEDMLCDPGTESRDEESMEGAPSSVSLTYGFFSRVTDADVIEREQATITPSNDSGTWTTPRERVNPTFQFAGRHKRMKASSKRNQLPCGAENFCDYSSEGHYSDCTHARASSGHFIRASCTSCSQSVTNSPVTRNRCQGNLVQLMKSLRTPGKARKMHPYNAVENDSAMLPLSSEQEDTRENSTLGHYAAGDHHVATRCLSSQICVALLDKLALALSFVAIAACWGIIDVGIEFIAHGKPRLEIAYYAILLLVSLGLINAAKRLRLAGPCRITFVASFLNNCFRFDVLLCVVPAVTFSFLSAVAGWGLVDTIVDYAAGPSASIKILYYFCFLACAVVCVLLYLYLLNPSFRLDTTCFA